MLPSQAKAIRVWNEVGKGWGLSRVLGARERVLKVHISPPSPEATHPWIQVWTCMVCSNRTSLKTVETHPRVAGWVSYQLVACSDEQIWKPRSSSRKEECCPFKGTLREYGITANLVWSRCVWLSGRDKPLIMHNYSDLAWTNIFSEHIRLPTRRTSGSWHDWLRAGFAML